MTQFVHTELNDRAWLAARYQNLPIASIAAQIGCSPTSVHRALVAHGIQRRSRSDRRPPIANPSLADPEWLATRYQTATITDIADELGVHPHTVSRAMTHHGIPRRSRADANRPHRPPELNDRDWLQAAYRTSTIAQIADHLDVSPASVQTSLVRAGIQRRSRSETQRRSRPAQLDDPAWLQERLNDVPVTAIAEELDVAVPTVQAALQLHHTPSPRRYDGRTRLPSPDPDQLEHAWQAHETIKGVARHFGVSVNTAAVWLAEVGIFVSETPTISRRDLETSIKAGESIDVIRRRHHVADRTVVVELHRHDLFDAHRRRHMPTV